MSGESIPFRNPSAGEQTLLRALLHRADIKVSAGDLSRVRVQPLDDGGMGSFRVSKDPSREGHRLLGGIAAAVEFTDEDGVLVSVTLNVDSDGEPFEVDVWKIDFTPLVRIPDDLAEPL